MRGIKILFGTTALLAGLALAPAAQAQIYVRYWCSAGLRVRLLRLCAVRLRALWLLRAGVLLQRHLPGHGPMGRVGLRPRLGRSSLHRGWRRKLSRQRRCSSQSQQLCTRRRRPPVATRGVRRSASQRWSCYSGAHQCASLPCHGIARNSFARTGFARTASHALRHTQRHAQLRHTRGRSGSERRVSRWRRWT